MIDYIGRKMKKKKILIICGCAVLLIAILLVVFFVFFKSKSTSVVVYEAEKSIEFLENYDVTIDLTGSIDAYYKGTLDLNTNEVNWQNNTSNETLVTENIYTAFSNYLNGVSSLNIDEVSFELDFNQLLQNNPKLKNILNYDTQFNCIFSADEYKIRTIECEQDDDYFLIEFTAK